MEVKRNESTNNRPNGDRILDASLVRVNFMDAVRQIKSETAWENSDRNAVTLVHNEHLRIVLIALKQHAQMSPHTVEGASFIQVMNGRIWVETTETSFSLDSGDGLAITAGSTRSFFAEEEAVILLTLTGNGPDRF